MIRTHLRRWFVSQGGVKVVARAGRNAKVRPQEAMPSSTSQLGAASSPRPEAPGLVLVTGLVPPASTDSARISCAAAAIGALPEAAGIGFPAELGPQRPASADELSGFGFDVAGARDDEEDADRTLVSGAPNTIRLAAASYNTYAV